MRQIMTRTPDRKTFNWICGTASSCLLVVLCRMVVVFNKIKSKHFQFPRRIKKWVPSHLLTRPTKRWLPSGCVVPMSIHIMTASYHIQNWIRSPSMKSSIFKPPDLLQIFLCRRVRFNRWRRRLTNKQWRQINQM